jgi:hypothetical protein
VLLILDKAVSHCTLAAVVFCKENHITCLYLLPYASYKIQPRHEIFEHVKAAYAQVDNWLMTNPGKTVSQRHVAGLFREVHTRTSTTEEAENAFPTTEVYLCWPNIIGS